MKLEHLHMIYIQIVYLIKIYIIHFKLLFIKTRIFRIITFYFKYLNLNI